MYNGLTVKKYMRKDILFYIAYFIFILSNIIFEYSELSYFNNLDILKKICLLLIYGLFMFKILLDNRRDITRLLIIGAILSCFFLSYYYSGYSLLFKGTLLICAAKDIDFNKLIKFDIKIKAVLVAIVIGLCLFGITNDYTMVREGEEVLRHSVGFIHPNILAGIIMTICFEWMYLRFYKAKIYDYLLIIGLFSVIYVITDSRTSLIAVALFLILSLIFRYIPIVFEKVKLLKILTILLTPLCTMISIIACINFTWKNDVLVAINQLFTGRIYQASVFIKQYGFFPLGQKINMISYRNAQADNVKAAIIDNAYINLGVIYGIIPLVLFCIAVMLLTRKLIKDKNYPLLITVITFIIYGFMETFVFNVTYNFSLIAISSLIYGINFRKPRRYKQVKKYKNVKELEEYKDTKKVNDKVNEINSEIKITNENVKKIDNEIKMTYKRIKQKSNSSKKNYKKIEKAHKKIRKAKRTALEATNIIREVNEEINDIWY